MPVTAKLSRNVYERLGDDVVNALVDWFNQVDATYRSDLREMNDLNFARFDAKMGERLAEFEARIERRFAALETKFERRFAEIETKFEHRFAEIETRLTHRIFYASAATFLAQLIALVTLFRMFAPAH